MAAKFDKELLIKHRFWILLGVMVPLLLTAFLLLFFGAASDIEEKENAYTDAEKQVKDKANAGQLKNDKFVQVLNEREKQATKVRDNIWEVAWKQQQDLLTTWPPLQYTDQTGPPSTKRFLSPLTPDDRAAYADDPNNGYASQIPQLRKAV